MIQYQKKILVIQYHKENLKIRGGRGLGAISTIMNILKDVSLGNYYFEIAMLLRQCLFQSTVLHNSETWINLTKTDIKYLETIDETLLRRILDAPAKTSLPALYQELGCYPLKYTIIGKRLSFLHHILSCD